MKRDYRKYFTEIDRYDIAVKLDMHPKSVGAVLKGSWQNQQVIELAKEKIDEKINHLQEVKKELDSGQY
jgi:hypothetical protein